MGNTVTPGRTRNTERFEERHIGPSPDERQTMLDTLGLDSLDALVDEVVPDSIRLGRRLELPQARGEGALLAELRGIAAQNRVARSLIGLGYHDTVTPPVVRRNIFENPGWYTQYTPYQPEISQGRLEMLLNFQTMIADLTGLPLANASMLDEGTAAAEGLNMCRAITRSDEGSFFVAEDCHPQTIAVVRTRAECLGVELHVGDPAQFDFAGSDVCGVLLQYPNSYGCARDVSEIVEAAHAAGAKVVVACDLLSLVLLRSPGAMGADIAVGSSQRFGVPLGAGGPHAAFLSTRDAFKRSLPGRLVGVSVDVHGNRALRLALQTREQHIRRDKATSNICTAQVLLAVMAAGYGIYHGPEGLQRIARRTHGWARSLREALQQRGFDCVEGALFDTVTVRVAGATRSAIIERSRAAGINLREDLDDRLGVAFDETCDTDVLNAVLRLFDPEAPALPEPSAEAAEDLPAALRREGPFMEHPVFSRYHSEHEMLRYLYRLQSRDLSLTHAMIPLGSCTMKLNAAAEMLPVTWPGFASIHPFAPQEQTRGYAKLYEDLQGMLCEITGFDAVSLQPNSGAQGEFAGLAVIAAYHRARGDAQRDVCLIPTSAHGTNPASAVMAGMRVVPVACDDEGNIEVADLKAKASEHGDRLAALMITYPSTHGVFETAVREVCDAVHAHGGQVYLDGANMNAQVGLCRPADFGADVCHLNLHKTFCIPHGGGGPGMGPIGVREHLAPFLPGHPMDDCGGAQAIGPIAAAPYGSPSILPISWMYIRLMGAGGLKLATEVAILNANYMAKRLEQHYPILYRGARGRVAHEFILDTRQLRQSAGINVDDIAKRLIDYGFHAPTMSWPVAGTLMVEPTESESLAEVDRFCDAMIAIRAEIAAIESGQADGKNNVLKHAPHTASVVTADDWERGYGRQQAAFPTAWQHESKFWPAVGRVDNAYGDRNLVCSCPPMEAYEADS